jgi:hypothetical protein
LDDCWRQKGDWEGGGRERTGEEEIFDIRRSKKTKRIRRGRRRAIRGNCGGLGAGGKREEGE